MKLKNILVLFFTIRLIWLTFFLYNLLNYGNEHIEKISTKERVARNFLSVINTSINENVILRQDFDISEDGKSKKYSK